MKLRMGEMQLKNNSQILLDVMVLLEVAGKMCPLVEHFFATHSTNDLINAAHDLIGYFHSNGSSELNAETEELLATLEAARTYLDCGGGGRLGAASTVCKNR